MITIKLKLLQTLPTELEPYLVQYASCFRKIFSNYKRYTDKTTTLPFKSYLLDNHDLLDASTLDTLKIQVASKIKKHELIQKDKVKLRQELLIKKVYTSEKDKFKSFTKLAYLNRTIGKMPVFGGKTNLSDATHYINIGDHAMYEQCIAQYREGRILNYCSVGRTCEKSNRKFNFHFLDNAVTFKPNRNSKYRLDYHVGKNQAKRLAVLNEYIGFIPITVEFSKTHIYIIYDNQVINNYGFNDLACVKEQKGLTDKDEKKAVYIKWCREQEKRQQKGKLVHRYAAVDLNPHYIGFSIIDKTNDSDEFTVVTKQCFKLSRLSTKLGVASDDKKQIKQNNKRRTEIKQVWARIFALVKYYKVSHFVMEELDFKPKTDEPKDFNRLTKNIWHRTLTIQLIEKWCQELGVKKLEVDPCYSSFIGNLCCRVFDPVAASLEIARRGLVKFTKGCSLFPDLVRMDASTLIDALRKNITSWVSLYKDYRLSGLRYRNKLDKLTCSEQVFQSYKSRVGLYTFG